MNKKLYPKLAAMNLRKNSKLYTPYILTCIGTVMLYYVISALSRSRSLESMAGGSVLKSILGFGSVVVALFSAVFLFYTNSFLIKRRKKEIGLFNILGMGKRHIAGVMVFETLYTAFLGLFFGLFLGILFSGILCWLLPIWLRFDVALKFETPVSSVLETAAFFLVLFLLILLHTLRQIHLAKPVELLKGGQTGEKEPKAKWLLALFGALCLGGGYAISILTVDPIAALLLFFVAVVLVIIGTYCLFTAGSITVLKILRKNKSYYYKTSHFISLSGMIYRMKQNAVGLANICILSTAVLVMVSSTVSLYMGMEDSLYARYPKEIAVTTEDLSEENILFMDTAVSSVLKQEKSKPENTIRYRVLSFAAGQQGTEFSTDISFSAGIQEVKVLSFIPLEDYNRMTGQGLSLRDGEVYIYSSREPYEENTLSVLNQTFSIRDRLAEFPGNGMDNSQITGTYYLVVKDFSVLQELDQRQEKAYKENASPIRLYYGFDLDGDEQKEAAVYKGLKEQLDSKSEEGGFQGYVESRSQYRQDFFALYGGLFFLGIFLGILFMMATVLIIYYKQISEGYEDKERFEIMEKVGLSRKEVKKAIHSQVMSVFFLPLVTAVIHIAFAFPVISRLLMALGLMQTELFIFCTIGSVAAFSLIYICIYWITAREYYKIVSQPE